MNVKKYVKKSMPVEVVQYNDKSITEWVNADGVERCVIDYVDRLCLKTHGGIITDVCEKGDYVVKEKYVGFYTIKKDYFEKTYEEIKGDD